MSAPFCLLELWFRCWHQSRWAKHVGEKLHYDELQTQLNCGCCESLHKMSCEAMPQWLALRLCPRFEGAKKHIKGIIRNHFDSPLNILDSLWIKIVQTSCVNRCVLFFLEEQLYHPLYYKTCLGIDAMQLVLGTLYNILS